MIIRKHCGGGGGGGGGDVAYVLAVSGINSGRWGSELEVCKFRYLAQRFENRTVEIRGISWWR
jgi:hypothetical protein